MTKHKVCRQNAWDLLLCPGYILHQGVSGWRLKFLNLLAGQTNRGNTTKLLLRRIGFKKIVEFSAKLSIIKDIPFILNWKKKKPVMLTYTRYPEFDFTCFVSKGETTIEDWLQAITNYGAEGMTTLELYDLRQQTNLFSVEEISRILKRTLSDKDLRPPKGKTAVLVDEAVKFGLARMYEMRAEAEDISSNTQVFLGLDQALDWLGEDVARCIAEQHPDISP